MGTIITPERHYPGQVLGQPCYWLITIWYAGYTITLSSDNLDVVSEAEGMTYHFVAGLLSRLRYSDRVGLVGEVNEGSSTSIDVLFPVDVAELEARGHSLEGSRVELARWIFGTDHSERKVIVRGEVANVSYGAEGEPVSFVAESVIWREGIEYPPKNQKVDANNWSNTDTLDDTELNAPYPVIIGYPGRVSAGVLPRGWVTGSRARRVDRTRVPVVNSGGTDIVGMNGLRAILAGHHIEAQRVYMNTDSDTSGERFAVLNGYDEKGQPVAYVDATPDGSEPGTGASLFEWEVTDPDGNPSYGLGRGSFSGFSTASDAVGTVINASYQPGSAAFDEGRFDMFVGWYDDSTVSTGGGLLGPDGEVMRGAGDVMLWWLSRSNKPIDYGRFAAAAPLLNHIKIDACADDFCRPYDWVQDHLVPLLPVTLTTGPEGIYPVVWRFDAGPEDAVFVFDTAVDPHIERVSNVRVDSSRVRNDFQILFAKSIRTGNHFGDLRLGAGPYDSDDPDAHVSLLCKLSQQRYRYANGNPKVVEHKIETEVIYDTASALAILSWMARAWCLAHKEVGYRVLESEWSHLERGMVGLLKDHELKVTWVVHVLDVQILDDDHLGIELLYVEAPVRDTLSYG